MDEFTVVLLYPDYLAENYGEDTYVGVARAEDAYAAAAEIQKLALLANTLDGDVPQGVPEDFLPVAVMRGNIPLELGADDFC